MYLNLINKSRGNRLFSFNQPSYEFTGFTCSGDKKRDRG